MKTLEKEFLEMIETHKGVIFKISKMYMDHEEDRNDLFQEIVFQAWKSYPAFEKRSKFSTWLYRIALNTSILFLRSEKRRKNLHRDFGTAPLVEHSYDNEQDRRLEAMYRAIGTLNQIDKALIFYHLENVSGKEMAILLGISEVNARVKLGRAKDKLRALLSENEINV